MIRFIIATYNALDLRYARYMKIVRFIMSGGTAAAVDLGLLFVLTDVAHVWYLLSAVLAFLVAFGVSFVLQKFWTFKDTSRDGMHTQAAVYFAITAVNLGVNTLLVYLFVQHIHVHYILAQIITSILIAIESYFLYQIFVFKKSTH